MTGLLLKEAAPLPCPTPPLPHSLAPPTPEPGGPAFTEPCSFSCSRVQPLLNALTKEVLHPESQSPNGVRFHFIGVYLEELSKVGGKEVSTDQVSQNLQWSWALGQR